MCLLEKVSSAIGYALFWDRQLCQQWQSHIPPTRHTPLCHQKRYFNRETWWHGGITYCCICTFCHRICLTRCKNIFYGDICCDKSVFKPANNAPTKAVWNDGPLWLLMFSKLKKELKDIFTAHDNAGSKRPPGCGAHCCNSGSSSSAPMIIVLLLSSLNLIKLTVSQSPFII